MTMHKDCYRPDETCPTCQGGGVSKSRVRTYLSGGLVSEWDTKERDWLTCEGIGQVSLNEPYQKVAGPASQCPQDSSSHRHVRLIG